MIAWSATALVAGGCAPAAAPAPSREVSSSAHPHSGGAQTAPSESAAAAEPGNRPSCKSAPFIDRRGQPPEQERLQMSKPGSDVPFGEGRCRGDREVWRDDGGRIRVCTLRSPVTLAGFPLAGDNYTLFHDNGVPSQTTLEKGLTVATSAGVAVECAAGFAAFDRDRHLDGCALARGTRFRDVAARAGGDVSFHADGSLEAATLDLPLTVLGVSFPPGTRARFHPSGKVAQLQLDNPVELAGYVVTSTVALHESGTLASFTLSEPHRVGTLDLEAFADVWLYEDGRPWHVEFVSQQGFMVHGEPWTDTRKVTFDCSGTVTHDETVHYQSDVRPPKFR